MSRLDSFLASVKLPTMSDVALALIVSLDNEQCTAHEVSAIIGKDPALTAHLLRLANSAQFGLVRGVSTPDDAIALVGLTRVRALALGTCLTSAFPALPGLDRQAFWQFSCECAGYAQWLARGVGIDAQVAWLTGMMVRLGEVLIGQVDPGAISQIEQLPMQAGDRWTRELQRVGFTEGQVMAELARRWNFPLQMVQALERTHAPLQEQAYSRLSAVLHVAYLLTELPEDGTSALDFIPVEVLDSLKLDFDWMTATLPERASFVAVAAEAL